MFLGMKAPPLDSQDELLALRALVAEQAAKLSAQEAEVIKRDSIIGLLRAQLELLRHRQHGASSEKIDRKIEQFELMLEEIEASRAEADARSGKGLLPDLDDTPTSRNADLCRMAFQLKSGCTQRPAVARRVVASPS